MVYQDLEKNTSPLVSLFIFTYNQENIISKTINSLLEQITTFHYEIIIAEDCSKDDTLNVCIEYFKKYPDIIRVIHNEQNKGIIKNYHESISDYARGRYIASVGGDDWWHDHTKIQKQVDFLENHLDYGMVFSPTLVFSEDKERVISTYTSKRQCTFENLMMDNFIPAPTACYRKSLFDMYVREIAPVEKQFICEDYPMWLWFSYKSKFYRIDEPLATYRVSSNSLSHFTEPKRRLDFEKRVFDMKLYMFEALGISNDALLHDMYLRFYYEHMLLASIVGDKEIEKDRKVFFSKHGYFLLSCLSRIFTICAKKKCLIRFVEIFQICFTKERFFKYLKFDRDNL